MLEAFGLTDPGCVRPNNEDFFISDPLQGIFILADGMGGAQAGEHASQLGAECLYRFLLSADSFYGLAVLEQGFRDANRAVRQAAEGDPSLDGMGTTLLAVREAASDQVQVGSVGDSRAYLYSGGHLSLITRDQTWVAEVGSRLGLSDEALKMHPMRHVLTMAIGSVEELRVYSQVIALAPGDQILLCSDGLHGVVDEKNLEETLDSEKSLEDKCHYFVEAAKRNGGPDNITAVLIRRV